MRVGARSARSDAAVVILWMCEAALLLCLLATTGDPVVRANVFDSSADPN